MRIMTITMEVSDEEATNLLKRFTERGQVEISGDTASVADAPATPAEPANAGGETDVNGVVWDERYHAGTKGTNKDGSWKARKGMDEATKQAAAAYEAQFKNPVADAPATPAAPETLPAPATTPETTAAPATTPETTAAPATTPETTAAPAAPVAPVAPVVPETPAAPAPVSFEQLTEGFTEVIGRIGQDALMAKLGQIYADAGVPADGSTLQTNETQRRQVLDAIKAL